LSASGTDQLHRQPAGNSHGWLDLDNQDNGCTHAAANLHGQHGLSAARFKPNQSSTDMSVTYIHLVNISLGSVIISAGEIASDRLHLRQRELLRQQFRHGTYIQSSSYARTTRHQVCS
jgi:hypothetical protein